MKNNVKKIIDRQYEIANNLAEYLPLPKFSKYTICNLRGGIGKTSIAFNLAYLIDDILAVDTCPQCNLTYFFDNDYLQHSNITTYSMLLPYFIPGLGNAIRVAKPIKASNKYFDEKNAFFIPSDMQLYILPSQITTALEQAKRTVGDQQVKIIDSMLYSLKNDIEREMRETNTSKVLIDTSPFFSGATHLSWYAADALIVPVRTDQQSVNSLELLIRTLSDPNSEFRKIHTSDNFAPKIQLVILTHCGWSTISGSRNVPNQQTKVYIEKVLDIIQRNITNFTTSEASNHLLLLDDFLGTGRISSAKSKPIFLLNAGDSMTINRVRTSVNASVDKVKSQLQYISNCIW